MFVERTSDVSLLVELRHEVLRKGLPVDEVKFSGDHLLSTRHYVVLNEDICIACLSLLSEPFDGESAWRLRAMAVREGKQKCGVGSRLMQFAIDDLYADGLYLPIWCHARVSAQSFYIRFNFEQMGNPFVFGNAGQSVVMLRN